MLLTPGGDCVTRESEFGITPRGDDAARIALLRWDASEHDRRMK